MCKQQTDKMNVNTHTHTRKGSEKEQPLTKIIVLARPLFGKMLKDMLCTHLIFYYNRKIYRFIGIPIRELICIRTTMNANRISVKEPVLRPNCLILISIFLGLSESDFVSCLLRPALDRTLQKPEPTV